MTMPALRRPPPWLIAGTLALVVLVAEVVMAAAIVDDRFARLLPLFVAGLGLVLVFRFPFPAMVGLMLLVASVFHEGFFAVATGGVELRAYEYLLGALLVVAVVRPKRATWGGLAGGALALFLLLVLVATVSAVAAGDLSQGKALTWGRSLFVLLVFYVVVRLFPTRNEVSKLLGAAAVVAAVATGLAVYLALSDGLVETFQDPGRQVIGEAGAAFKRVRLPAVALAFGLFFYAVTMLGRAEGLNRRLLWTFVVAGFSISITLSLNRNMWLGVAFGVILLLLLGGSQVRWRLSSGLAVTGVAIAWFLGAGPTVERESLVYPLVERSTTLLEADASKDASLRDRQRENVFALETLRDNAIFGIGVGTPYGAFTSFKAPSGRFTRVPRRFVHNQYLYLALVGGVPALLAFLVFLGAVLTGAVRAFGTDLTVVACGIGVAALMLSAVVMLSFSVYNLLMALGLLCGSIVALTHAQASPETPIQG